MHLQKLDQDIQKYVDALKSQRGIVGKMGFGSLDLMVGNNRKNLDMVLSELESQYDVLDNFYSMIEREMEEKTCRDPDQAYKALEELHGMTAFMESVIKDDKLIQGGRVSWLKLNLIITMAEDLYGIALPKYCESL
jgi:hypothetical protein